jgi:hypothetical protein
LRERLLYRDHGPRAAIGEQQVEQLARTGATLAIGETQPRPCEIRDAAHTFRISAPDEQALVRYASWGTSMWRAGPGQHSCLVSGATASVLYDVPIARAACLSAY